MGESGDGKVSYSGGISLSGPTCRALCNDLPSNPEGLALAEALNLSAKELEHFAAHDDYLIDGKGWLNALPSERSLDENFSESLLAAVMALLQYCSLKEALKVRDDRLVELLKDPSALGTTVSL